MPLKASLVRRLKGEGEIRSDQVMSCGVVQVSHLLLLSLLHFFLDHRVFCPFLDFLSVEIIQGLLAVDQKGKPCASHMFLLSNFFSLHQHLNLFTNRVLIFVFHN